MRGHRALMTQICSTNHAGTPLDAKIGDVNSSIRGITSSSHINGYNSTRQLVQVAIQNRQDSWCKWPSSAEVLPTLLQFGSRVERCSGGRRGRRGRAAAEASAAGAAGADAQLADPPAAAGGPSCKGKCKTESVMIGMNALIDLEYAAGTLSVECTDAQSM